MEKIKKFCIILCLITFAVLNGCGYESQKSFDYGSFNTNAVVLGAGRHLAPGVKDAYYCSKILQVWEPLITQGEDGFPKGQLVENWEMLENGKEWIFRLRKGVKFHNGTPFNADAVIKNFDRMSKGTKRSAFYGLDIDNYYPSLKSYEKIDDYTVKLIFGESNINELYKMMDFGSAMFAPECFDENENFNGFAIGTGPYKIKENVLNKYVSIERNDDYYGKKASIKEFIIKNIPNPDIRYSALKSEEILGVLDLNAIPPFLAEEVKKDGRFAISTNKSTMVRFLAMNGTRFPFNDVRMRRAVSLAIDRNNLVNALYLNYAQPAVNILNYTSPYYKEFKPEYNLILAKQLAYEVLGNKRAKIVYCINGSDPMQKGEAELIAYWLKDIGLDVEIKPLEYATMLYCLRKGEYDIARLQQGLPNGDPYSVFYSFLMPQGGRNISTSLGYKNDEVVKLMEEVCHVEDEDRRMKLYERIQEIAVNEQPVVPLFYDINIVAYNKKINNYKAMIYGVNLADVTMGD